MTNLASMRNGARDGMLVAVSADHQRYAVAPAPTLQAALERWESLGPELAALAVELDRGAGEPLDVGALLAPLPRAYQYCEGSTYLSHMERCRAARNAELPPGHGVDPAVLLGASDRFLAPRDPIELADEEWGLDIEATVAVVVGDVRRGVTPSEAAGCIRLAILVNDLTLRNVLPVEFAKGLGLYQAKPLRTLAPIAVTVEALGDAWDGRLLHATVKSWIGTEPLGALDCGVDAAFDFPEVIAYAARTRPLAAGTIVGTGTVSNRDLARGFGCLAEKRAIEIIEGREPTPYLRIGDSVRIEAVAGERSLFGAIASEIVAAGDGDASFVGVDGDQSSRSR